MTTSTIGLIAGLLLAIAIVTGGFAGFVIAIVLGGAGYVLGANLDGELDLSALTRRNRG